MVEVDGFVELPTQVINKTKGEESLRVACVQTHTLFEMDDSTLVLLCFAAGVC